ncbi:Protein CC2D2B [Sciurus carolinensis]|uniref:Protein CC2D2B n=1 Tax=Sciurus carolinensis TaxID=30640 RepID=A0AA41T1N9_SCICA|nr:Protein CC2D2B [Sciurus carolinensis]
MEEVIFTDLIEIKAAEYEDDQEQIKKQQANIFVPSSSPVTNKRKLPEGMMPRILEDEGFYIQRKPEIYKKTCNKMENRLLKLEKASAPAKRLNHSAIKSDLESSLRSKMEGHREMYQVDLNIVGLQFSHHPLFNKEQVLCARLLQFYECFQDRQQQNLSQLLYEKLKALTNAIQLANENFEIDPLTRKSLQDYYWQINNTKWLYDLEKEKDLSLLHNILQTWKQIKSLRLRQGFTSTPIKLQFQRKTQLLGHLFSERVLNKWSFVELIKKKVYEISKRTSLLAKLYLPLPNNTEVKGKTVLEYIEFSSDKLVIPVDGEVGSNVPFLLEGNKTEELCLLTSGKLSYSLSWALDENGIPLIPMSQSRSAYYSVLRNVDARSIPGIPWLVNAQKLFEWANEVRIDPNNPEYSDLVEFITYMRHKGQDISDYFRLEQLQDEFNFVSEEEMKKSKRFQLLQLRNAGQLDIFLLQQMPLYDREIPDLVSQVRRSIMKRIIKISKFSLPDIVADYEEIVSASQLTHAICKFIEPRRKLKPWRKERKKVTAQTISDGDIKILIRILRAYNIPTRRTTVSSSPGHDYSISSLSRIRDNVYINIFDEIVIEKHEISGTFQVNIPPVLLGYTWSKTYISPKEDDNGQNFKECPFLNIFATIEPQISYIAFNSKLDKRCISLALGNKEEHAILLCNFFLYFGKKALVLLGTSLLEGHVAYVLTQEPDEYWLWNPSTGQCHKQFDPFCPLQSVDCLFNDSNVAGFPIQMRYTDVQSVIDAVYQTGIHSSEFPQTEFALAVYIHPYPNNILSVWVYLASLARHR